MSENKQLLSIIGKKIVAIKGLASRDKRHKEIEPYYILFDDGETYIELQEQDYYSYHDCSSNARILSIYIDKELWPKLMELNDANTDY